jgi:Zn-dependent protease with chaperone function
MHSFRAALAVCVLMLFPFVVLALVVGLLLVVVLVGMQSSVAGRGLGQLLLVPLVIGIVAAVREAVRARPQPAEGPELTRSGHPELWRTLDQLADVVHTAPPERIVLTPEVNAGVYQIGPRRELVLGLPLLAGMTVGELRSVLAHELGHFAGGDTRLAARTLRARRFIVAARDNAGVFIKWFFALYYRVVVFASAASSRDVELRADRFSAEAAGPAVAAAALRKVTSVEVGWDFVLEHRVPMFDAAGARAPLHEAVARTLRVHDEEVRRATDARIAAEQLGWDDSHPPTAARIAAFEALPASALPADDRPATALLGGGPAGIAALEGELLTRPWPLSTWDDVVARAVAQALPERLDRLLLALHDEGALPAATPAALLQAVHDDPAALGAHLTDDPAQAPDIAAEAARIVTRGVLARTPGVRGALDDEDELVLRDASGSPIDTTTLAAEVATGTLAERLATLGGRVDLVVDPSSLPVDEPSSVVLGALTLTIVKKPRKQIRDLLVCSDGLLLVPVRVSYWSSLGGAHTKHNQRLRVEELARRIVELRADPANEWIAEEAVASAHLQLLPTKLTLLLTDGRRIEFGLSNEFQEIGLLTEHPLPALLGDRFRSGRPQRSPQPVP